ncbi:hypothetical protein SDC9_158946 [bioreactor metagenome]|uniref:Uncharacterized protein n=1 Tax=bioreactor metagenome TaxID=1076179 RepID=A0A645FDV5_9ZZZZ
MCSTSPADDQDLPGAFKAVTGDFMGARSERVRWTKQRTRKPNEQAWDMNGSEVTQAFANCGGGNRNPPLPP